MLTSQKLPDETAPLAPAAPPVTLTVAAAVDTPTPLTTATGDGLLAGALGYLPKLPSFVAKWVAATRTCTLC